MSVNPGIMNVTSIADLNARLPVDFPEGSFPVLVDETQWRDWADQVVYTPPFLALNAPGSIGYNTSQDWLQAFLGVLTL